MSEALCALGVQQLLPLLKTFFLNSYLPLAIKHHWKRALHILQPALSTFTHAKGNHNKTSSQGTELFLKSDKQEPVNIASNEREKQNKTTNT